VRLVQMASCTEDIQRSLGPLGQCPQILCLHELSADTYQSIGLTQRYFSRGADRRVTYAPGFEPFSGLYVD